MKSAIWQGTFCQWSGDVGLRDNPCVILVHEPAEQEKRSLHTLRDQLRLLCPKLYVERSTGTQAGLCALVSNMVPNWQPAQWASVFVPRRQHRSAATTHVLMFFFFFLSNKAPDLTFLQSSLWRILHLSRKDLVMRCPRGCVTLSHHWKAAVPFAAPQHAPQTAGMPQI